MGSYVPVSEIKSANTNTGYEARRLLTRRLNEDGDAAGNVAKDINISIPSNRYSFFEELEDKMLVPMQLQFEITLNDDDDELIHKAHGADDGRVVVNRFLLWVPKLNPKDSMYENFVNSFLKETKWKYLRELYQDSTPTVSSSEHSSVVEHRTGNREVTGSNPVEVLNFFQASLRNYINCVHNCDDHFFISIINVSEFGFVVFCRFLY